MADLLKDLKKVANDSWKMGKDYALGTPEIEIKTREATNNEPWGPTTQQMQELAHASHSYAELPIVMNMLWKRMGDTGKDWRHVYKSLIVLDYLIKHGSEQSIREMRYHIVDLQTLTSFQYMDENYQDQGQSVRERAKKVLELLHDEKRLKEERAKAQQNRSKYQGFGSDSVMRGGPRNGGGFDYDSRYDNRPYRGDAGQYEDGGYGGDSYRRNRSPYETRRASPGVPQRGRHTEESESDSDSDFELPSRSTATSKPADQTKGASSGGGSLLIDPSSGSSAGGSQVPRRPSVDAGEEFDPFKQLATTHAVPAPVVAPTPVTGGGGSSVLPPDLFSFTSTPATTPSAPPAGVQLGGGSLLMGSGTSPVISTNGSTQQGADSDWDTFVAFDDPKKPKPDDNDIWNKHKNLFDLQHLNISDKDASNSGSVQQKRPMATMMSSSAGRGRGAPTTTAGSPAKPATTALGASPLMPSGPGATTTAVRSPPLTGLPTTASYPAGVAATPYGMPYTGGVMPAGMMVPAVGYAPGVPGMMPMGYHTPTAAAVPYGSAPAPIGSISPLTPGVTAQRPPAATSSSGPSLLF